MNSSILFSLIVMTSITVLSFIIMGPCGRRALGNARAAHRRRVGAVLHPCIFLMVPPVASGLATGSLPAGLAVAALVLVPGTLESVHEFRMRGVRRRCVNRDLPLLLDFLVLNIQSGHSIMQSLQFAVVLFPGHSPVRKGLFQFQEGIRLGSSVQSALKELGDFLGTSESRNVFMTVSQAVRHGTPLGMVLKRQAAQMKDHLIVEGERFANTLSVKLLLPLLFLIFPSCFLVIFSPVIVSFTSFLP